MDVLSEHAFPEIILIESIAFINRRANLFVRVFQQILEPDTIRVLFGYRIDLIDEDSGVRNRPKFSIFIDSISEVVGPVESSQASS